VFVSGDHLGQAYEEDAMTQHLRLFGVIIFALLLPTGLHQVYAMTLDYTTSTDALAGACWYDPFWGYVCPGDSEHDENTSAASSASAYYEIQFGGEARISASTNASTEPNQVILSSTLQGSYDLDIGWEAELIDAFYQDANSTVEGWLKITEFGLPGSGALPLGAPCRLKVDISFPLLTWTGGYAWQAYIESSSDYFLAGLDELGRYGSLSGTVDAHAGEEIYFFLGNAGWGYADHEIGEALGYGTVSINVALAAIPHVADLSADGCIDFEDFALLSSQWRYQGCEDPDADWCRRADLDQSGQVDPNDLDLFADYWLLPDDPNLLL
jgi:hypothetical protein